MYIPCSFASLLPTFSPVFSSLSCKTSLIFIFKFTEYVSSRSIHSRIVYFGFVISELTYSSVNLFCASWIGKIDLKTRSIPLSLFELSKFKKLSKLFFCNCNKFGISISFLILDKSTRNRFPEYRLFNIYLPHGNFFVRKEVPNKNLAQKWAKAHKII